MGSVEKKCTDNRGVSVGSCKVKRGRARGTNDWGRGISVSVRVSPGQPSEKKLVSQRPNGDTKQPKILLYTDGQIRRGKDAGARAPAIDR